MKHEIKAKYPAKSDVVLKMFTDKEFHTRKLQAMGLKNYRVLECTGGANDFRIKIERKVPTEAPALVKKFIPAETTAVNEERWNSAKKTGVVQVQPQGVPVEMSCTASFKDEGAGCVITYVWDVKAKVPLVGGALEKFVCSDMDKRLADETRAAIGLLPKS